MHVQPWSRRSTSVLPHLSYNGMARPSAIEVTVDGTEELEVLHVAVVSNERSRCLATHLQLTRRATLKCTDT